MTKIEVHFDVCEGAAAILGESPFWDHGDFIWWVDIVGRKLLRTRLSTRETSSWPTPEMPGFVVLTGPDEPVLGMETGIYASFLAEGRFEKLVAFEAAGERFNDATVDDGGRLWVSTMAIDAEPGRGALHVVTPDFALRTAMDGLTTPNGLAADAGRDRLFISDSHPQVQTIWTATCDFRTGEVGCRTEFASTKQLAGRPDGAAPGTSGRYWIAGVDGAALYGFSTDGLLELEAPLPFPAPTKLAFFDGGVAVTAKGEGGYGGHLALAAGTEPFLNGPAIPFWRPGNHPITAQRGI